MAKKFGSTLTGRWGRTNAGGSHKTAMIFTGDWNGFAHRTNPRRAMAAMGTVDVATLQNATLYRSLVINYIISRRYAANAFLTRDLKGSSTPLIDHGDLIGNIQIKRAQGGAVFVGFIRGKKVRRKGPDFVDFARNLHEGGTIVVTSKMRTMFWMLHLVSTGQAQESTLKGRAAAIWDRIKTKGIIINPIGKGTKGLLYPSRPFMREPLEDPYFQRRCAENWKRALAGVIWGSGGTL